jgi:hypothetical protein
VGVAALPLSRAESDHVLQAGWRISALAVIALVVVLVLGWTAFLPLSLGTLGGYYGLQLAVDDAGLDLATPLVAVGLVVSAELAYWSLEETEPIERQPVDGLRRLVWVAAVALGTFVLASLLLALVDVARTGGLATDLLGAAAAAGAVLTIVLLARRETRTEKSEARSG